MVDHPVAWPPLPQCHGERVHCQCCIRTLARGPAYDAPSEGIEHDPEVAPAFTSAVLRQVRHPQPVWCVGSELALHEIRVERPPGITAGDATKATSVDAEQSCRPHEPGHPLAGAPEPLAQPQLCMHPR